MKIRSKLTLQFLSIVAAIFLASFLSIYFFSSNYREDDFYSRLKGKAENVSKLLIQVEEINAELLRKIEKDNPSSLPKEKIVIYNYKNEIEYTSDEEKFLTVTREQLDEIRLEGEIRFVQNKFEVIGFLYIDKYDRFVVIAGAQDIYGTKRLANLGNNLILVFFLIIFVTSLAGWIYSGKALKPISKVVEQVNEISISSLNLRVDEGNKRDEIANLAKTFNNMLDRLETSFKMQKTFIANASHELRTPLHSISGQMEVALLKNREPKEYKQMIVSVLEDIKNLNNISNRLLILAQTSSNNSKSDFIKIRIDELVWQSRADLLKINSNYCINVDIDDDIAEDSKLTIIGNEILIKTAISNLMENACKYSENHTVQIKLTNENQFLVIHFIDNGIGISAEDQVLIFEPFYRGKNAQQIKGHGIGLSLVERIAKLHNGSVTLKSSENSGTSFSLSFPRVQS